MQAEKTEAAVRARIPEPEARTNGKAKTPVGAKKRARTLAWVRNKDRKPAKARNKDRNGVVAGRRLKQVRVRQAAEPPASKSKPGIEQVPKTRQQKPGPKHRPWP